MLAWLPLAWMVFEWRRTSRKLGLTLKALSLAAILLALAEPRMILQETKVAARRAGGYFRQLFRRRSGPCLATGSHA